MKTLLSFARSCGRWIHGRWTAWRQRGALQVDLLPAGALDQSVVLRAALADLLRDRQSERRTSMGRAALYAGMVVLPIVFWAGPSVRQAVVDWFWEPQEVVAVVKLTGTMAEGTKASAQRLVPALRKAFASQNVQAIVLEIDSGGGSPLEAERIYSVIEAERKRNPKPVVAVINNVGASAAYMVAMHCDQIYAGKYSLVGSIGAVIDAWNFNRALGRFDVAHTVYASGELKAMLNPWVPSTGAADRKAQELVQDIAREFVGDLVERRGVKLAKGVNFATGEVWGGAQAKALGLVDEVGTLDEVLRARWPNAKVKTVGSPAAGGMPFGEAVNDWVRSLVAEAVEPRVVVR